MTIINPQFVVAVTGGGSQVISDNLRKGGASSWFLEGLVPYNQNSLVDFLGHTPEKFASEITARQMAMQAFKRAIELDAPVYSAVGIGCTASLGRIDGEREGRSHKAFIAIQTAKSTEIIEWNFYVKRSREQEEALVAQLIDIHIKEIREDKIYSFPSELSKEEIDDFKNKYDADTYNVSRLLLQHQNKRDYILVGDGDTNRFLETNSVIFPGSFNPIHEGHAAIVNAAAKKIGKRVYLEISLTNVDKPPLDFIDISDRIARIYLYPDAVFQENLAGIIVSNTPKFYDKIWQYPTASYIAGTDTINRIFDTKYGDVAKLIELIKDTNSTFLMSDRPGHPLNINPYYKFDAWYIENRFQFLDGVKLKISSSEIRKREQTNA